MTPKKLSPERLAKHLAHEMASTVADEIRGHIEALEAELAEANEWCGFAMEQGDKTAMHWHGEFARSQQELAESRAECERLRDDPTMDATDAAHPAWWRGHDHTAKNMEVLVEKLRAQIADRDVLLKNENKNYQRCAEECERLRAELGSGVLVIGAWPAGGDD